MSWRTAGFVVALRLLSPWVENISIASMVITL
jgi:hypothetical protein